MRMDLLRGIFCAIPFNTFLSCDRASSLPPDRISTLASKSRIYAAKKKGGRDGERGQLLCD